jgi:hypothetical protein
MIGRKVKGNVKVMRAGMLPKRPIRKGEKERKKRKIEIGQWKP